MIRNKQKKGWRSDKLFENSGSKKNREGRMFEMTFFSIF